MDLIVDVMGYTLWQLSTAMEHHNVEEVNHGTKWAMASIAMLSYREKTSMKNYLDSIW